MSPTHIDPTRAEELLVKVVDGLATPLEEQELMAHIADHPELQHELDAHRGLKALTDGWVQRMHLDTVEDGFMNSPVARTERAIGTTLFVGGMALLTGWGLVEAMLDPAAPLPLRIGIGALGAGTLLLLFSVIRWRMTVSKHDAYTEVTR